MALKHIPCAPGAHIGESIARDYLQRHLTHSQGVVLTNYHHPAGNGTDEHDLVLINERGVWTIEVKHWFGRIDADEVHWLHNGHRHHSPVVSVEKKARPIATAVQDTGITHVSTVGLVVLSRHKSKLRSTLPPEHRRKVFCLNNLLIEAVTGREYLYRPNSRNLSPTEIQTIADALVKCKVDPNRRMIGSYRLLRELEPGDGFDAYEAQHNLIPERRARIKRYHVSGYTSKKELDDAVQRFVQDMQALEQLEGHPNIVNAYDFLADPDSDDTYWLILEWIEGGTLLNRIDDDDDPLIPFHEQVRILRSVASALEACHSKGILHRNLTPASVYLPDNGEVQLGDFDFARVPGIGKTISITGRPLVVNAYTAPEMRDSFRQADARVDLYALGAIWYDMALHPTEPLIVPQNIDHADMPEHAKTLLRKLLAQQPASRPASATDVREWLDTL